ncbi:MAG: glutamine--fructose-6-phosphate transaminase (isomerizing) [Dehalococcoidia bacterium]|nr:glutamine--fructose-6-phosphate transaminase (isomerizing) [Dehalococcoidia bacterium]MDW8119539.1 glutamine--fructose-6-phosphate transaminase (isomerizing) [Chloroflexota bacterium]
MCGIVGYTGARAAAPILLEGLGRLEYRGYDSAGLVVVSPTGALTVRKTPGKLVNLVAALHEGGMPVGTWGLGHTRWATHGAPTEVNAHPHLDCTGTISVVHNGIVENAGELARQLEDAGHRFVSETDTEVIAHLLEQAIRDGKTLEDALRWTAQRLRGANAIAVLWAHQAGHVAAVRLGYAGGIIVGYGQGEMFLASDLQALLPYTRRVVHLAHGEMAIVTPSGASYCTLDGRPLQKEPVLVPYTVATSGKGFYRHFTLKEICEQSEAMTSALRGRLHLHARADVALEREMHPLEAVLPHVSRVVLVGMGTSFHACQVGRVFVENLAGIPAEADNASEFRYRNPVLDRRTLLVAVTQSGETADTLSCMAEARQRGASVLALCNVEGSEATRQADGVLYLKAGLEVGVASTKTFLNSLLTLYLLALHLGKVRGTLSAASRSEAIGHLIRLPALVGELVENTQAVCQALAERYFKYHSFLYLGRGVLYPIALEGALKLKELSYIHAEGYAAGEMKHGPIALLDPEVPVVALAPQGRLYPKMLSNIAEVRARGSPVIAIGTQGDTALAQKVEHFLPIPPVPELLTPFVAVVPLQLLAYYIAVRRGCDVDQPRNLAKSVTVE